MGGDQNLPSTMAHERWFSKTLSPRACASTFDSPPGGAFSGQRQASNTNWSKSAGGTAGSFRSLRS